jgi:hypothetical protein
MADERPEDRLGSLGITYANASDPFISINVACVLAIMVIDRCEHERMLKGAEINFKDFKTNMTFGVVAKLLHYLMIEGHTLNDLLDKLSFYLNSEVVNDPDCESLKASLGQYYQQALKAQKAQAN